MIYPTPIHDPFPARTTRPSKHRPWSSPLRSARSRCVAWIRQTLTTLYDKQLRVLRCHQAPGESVYGRLLSFPWNYFREKDHEDKWSMSFVNEIRLLEKKRDRSKEELGCATWRRNFSENITDAEVDKEAYSSVDMPTTSFEKDRMARRWMWIETNGDWERIAFKLKEGVTYNPGDTLFWQPHTSTELLRTTWNQC